MIFEKEEEIEEIEGQSMNEIGAEVSTGFLAEDILTELENIEYEDMDEVDSNLIEGHEISKSADENNNNDDENFAQSLPDLISGVSVLGVETKLSGSVPDLVACCLPTSSSEIQKIMTTPQQGQDITKEKLNTNLRKQELGKRTNHHQDDADTTDFKQKEDSSRRFDFRPQGKTNHDRLAKQSLNQEKSSKSSWAETGTHLRRIAEAEESRRRPTSNRPSSVLHQRTITGTAEEEEDELEPLIEKYSDVLSTLAIAGISYLVRRMFN